MIYYLNYTRYSSHFLIKKTRIASIAELDLLIKMCFYFSYELRFEF